MKLNKNYNRHIHEIKASAFAIELLIPEFLIEKDILHYFNENNILQYEKAINELSEKYRVEKELMEKRFIMLGYNIL